MIEYYLQIRMVHIWAISISGALFVLRSSFSIMGANWPHALFIRITSYLIDTTLLTAATMLWTILPKETFATNWLFVKLILVVCYILFGFVTMKQKHPKPVRIGALICAILIYSSVVIIARAHDPLAILFWLNR